MEQPKTKAHELFEDWFYAKEEHNKLWQLYKKETDEEKKLSLARQHVNMPHSEYIKAWDALVAELSRFLTDEQRATLRD